MNQSPGSEDPEAPIRSFLGERERVLFGKTILLLTTTLTFCVVSGRISCSTDTNVNPSDLRALVVSPSPNQKLKKFDPTQQFHRATNIFTCNLRRFSTIAGVALSKSSKILVVHVGVVAPARSPAVDYLNPVRRMNARELPSSSNASSSNVRLDN